MRMGSEASGQGRQVKQIRVLFAIRHRSAPRSERFSALFPLLRKNQLAPNRLVGAFGAPGQPAVPLPAGALFACYVLLGIYWLALPTAAEDRLPGPRVRVAEREFGEPMSDYSEKWDAFDYLTVAGFALFLGGLGSALFRATRRGALLLPAGLAFMATAAYGARRNGVPSSRSDNRGEDRLNLTMPQGSLPEVDIGSN
jgi:hypothetical protein